MDQNRRLSVRSIWAKSQNFERFFKQCVFLIGLPLVKISSRSNNNWGNNSQKSPKRDHFMDAESMQKTLKMFTFHNQICYTDGTYTNIYINKVFHLAKSWREHKQKKLTKWDKKSFFWPKFGHFISQKNLCHLLDWKPFKNDEKSLLFHLKRSFRSQNT